MGSNGSTFGLVSKNIQLKSIDGPLKIDSDGGINIGTDTNMTNNVGSNTTIQGQSSNSNVGGDLLLLGGSGQTQEGSVIVKSLLEVYGKDINIYSDDEF